LAKTEREGQSKIKYPSMARFILVVAAVAFLLCTVPLVESDGTSETKATELLRWLQEHGAKPGNVKLEVKHEDHILHVVAKEDLDAGEEIFVLPQDLALRSGRLPVVLPEAVAHPSLRTTGYLMEIALSLVLLFEKHVNKEESKWAKYIATLPQKEELRAFPLFWSEEAVNDLRGSNWAAAKVNSLREAVQVARMVCLEGVEHEGLDELQLGGELAVKEPGDNNENKKRYLPAEACSEDELKWALTIVIARVWKGVEEGRTTAVLLPFVDFLGRKATSGTLVATVGTNYVLKGDRAYSKGEPVFVFQGAKPTFIAAMESGVLPPKEEWSIQITSAFKSNTPFGKLQELLHQAIGCDGTFQLDLTGSMLREKGGLWNYLACRRVAVLNPTEYSRIHANNMTYNELKRMTSQPITIENEMRSIKMLRSSIAEALSGYPSRIEEDEKLLASADLPEDRRLAIGITKADKFVWINTYTMLEKHWVRFIR